MGALDAYRKTFQAIAEKQVGGWIFIIVAIIVQGVFLAVLLDITLGVRSKLSNCQNAGTIATCPSSSEMNPIWVVLLVSAVVGLVFVLLGAVALTKASL